METPNYVGMFIDAQQAGRQQAKQRAVDNALAKASTDPGEAQNALIRAGALDQAAAVGQIAQRQQNQKLRQGVADSVKAGDYTGAQQQAVTGGDFELAKALNGMHDDQLKEADHKVGVLGGIAHYLSTVPADQRQALWDQTAPHLIQQGMMKPDEAQKVDLSDQGLQAYQAQSLDIKTQVEMEFKKRAEQMAADKFAHTKEHDHATEAETARSHRANEAHAAGMLGVAQGNLNERRKENPATAGAGKWEPF